MRGHRHAGDASRRDRAPAEVLRVVEEGHAADDRVTVVRRDDAVVGRSWACEIDGVLTAERLAAQFELGGLIAVRRLSIVGCSSDIATTEVLRLSARRLLPMPSTTSVPIRVPGAAAGGFAVTPGSPAALAG